MSLKRLLLVLWCFSASAHADPTATVGRYLTVDYQPLPAQKDLLQQTVEVHFPKPIQTIGGAWRYLLRWSGYALVSYTALSNLAQALLDQPLPPIDRHLGPVHLQEGLLTLAGQPFGLLIDPVHRLVGLRLKPAYQALYSSHLDAEHGS